MTGWDPWSIDYFNPPTPHVAPPTPKARVPKLLPEVERLYQVQRNSLKVLNDLEAFGSGNKDRHQQRALQSLQRDAENTYKVIRKYLEEHDIDQSL